MTIDASSRIVAVGEMLLRASPPTGRALEAAETWTVHVGGAEANVIVHLGRLEENPVMVTWLPDNPLGWRARRWLQSHSIDTTYVTMVPGGRMGLYFTEPADGGRPSTVVYDRDHTPIRAATEFPGDALEGADGLHVTGITAVCAPRLFEAAVDAARERSLSLSYDCNYRADLGSVAQARKAFEFVAQDAALLFITKRDAEDVLGLHADAAQTAIEMAERFSHTVCVVSDGPRGAVAADRDQLETAAALATANLDGIGRGDALCAGFLWGRQRGDLAYALRCGVAMAGISQVYLGDSGWVTRSQLEDCLKDMQLEPETRTVIGEK